MTGDYDKEIWQTGTLNEVRRITKALNIVGNDVAAVFKFFQFILPTLLLFLYRRDFQSKRCR
jgi:Na+/H+-translocating membrane pyrophosphatase